MVVVEGLQKQRGLAACRPQCQHAWGRGTRSRGPEGKTHGRVVRQNQMRERREMWTDIESSPTMSSPSESGTSRDGGESRTQTNRNKTEDEALQGGVPDALHREGGGGFLAEDQ